MLFSKKSTTLSHSLWQNEINFSPIEKGIHLTRFFIYCKYIELLKSLFRHKTQSKELKEVMNE